MISTTLGSNIFENCKSLTNIKFNGTKEEWEYNIIKDPLQRRHSAIKQQNVKMEQQNQNKPQI